jgi:nucleotide-binding universal stress UspA family protein
MDDAGARSKLSVVGYDGSEAAERGAARAAELLARGGTLLLVGVEVEAYSAGALSESLIESGEQGAIQDAVARAGMRFSGREGVRVETVVLRGDTATVLVELADRRGADLIVVGRRGRDFAARVVLGSVAQRVVESARCDVLVVV